MDISRVGTSGGGDSPPSTRNIRVEQKDASGSVNREEGNSSRFCQENWRKLLFFSIFVFALITLVWMGEQAYRQFRNCTSSVMIFTASSARLLPNFCLISFVASLFIVLFTFINFLLSAFFVERLNGVFCRAFLGIYLMIFLSSLIVFGYGHTLGFVENLTAMMMLAFSCLIFFCAFFWHFVTPQSGVLLCRRWLHSLERDGVRLGTHMTVSVFNSQSDSEESEERGKETTV